MVMAPRYRHCQRLPFPWLILHLPNEGTRPIGVTSELPTASVSTLSSSKISLTQFKFRVLHCIIPIYFMYMTGTHSHLPPRACNSSTERAGSSCGHVVAPTPTTLVPTDFNMTDVAAWPKGCAAIFIDSRSLIRPCVYSFVASANSSWQFCFKNFAKGFEASSVEVVMVLRS